MSEVFIHVFAFGALVGFVIVSIVSFSYSINKNEAGYAVIWYIFVVILSAFSMFELYNVIFTTIMFFTAVG